LVAQELETQLLLVGWNLSSAIFILLESFMSKIVEILNLKSKDIFQHTPTQDMGFEHYGHEIFFDEAF
jgi:hypothetical protein